MTTPPDQRDSPDSESSPALLCKDVKIPEPIPVTFNDNQDDTLKANILAFNTQVTMLHAMASTINSWGKAMSYMSKLTELIKLRCEILGHPYGASARSNAKGNIVHIDD